MDYVYEKWGGIPHYSGVVQVLGEDEHGSWLWGPPGRTIYRGNTPMRVTQDGTVILVPPEAWWSISWPLNHRRMNLYVNINTPAVWEESRIVSIDLDLDVVRLNDGKAEIVDQDEFELHQRMYGYPDDIIQHASRAAEESFALVTKNAIPFDRATADSWIERGLSL